MASDDPLTLVCACGWTLTTPARELARGLTCICCGRPWTEGRVRTKRQRLGDWTKAQLARLGVTEDRYREAKRRFGLAPTCNCQERKEWLDHVSDWWRAG